MLDDSIHCSATEWNRAFVNPSTACSGTHPSVEKVVAEMEVDEAAEEAFGNPLAKGTGTFDVGRAYLIMQPYYNSY